MGAMRPLLFALLFMSFALPARAQQTADPPPDILQIYVDAVKPGKMPEYSRIENEAAALCARASTWPYMAMESKSGPQEVWFLSGFDSYAAMESSDQPFLRNSALSADLNRLMEGKTNLVSDPHTIFLRYRGDLSRNRGLVPPQTRFFIVSVVKIHRGHEQEYEQSQLLLRSARERAGTVDNRAVYQVLSGIPDDTYITFQPHRSFRSAGSTLDSLLDYDDLDDGVRGRLRELQAASIVSTETFIFSINPSISNHEGEWIADDPEFWKASPPLQRQGAKK
jgi:hypothetical protein